VSRGSIAILLPDPSAYLASYARQLAVFERQASLTVQLIAEQSRDPDLLPQARQRSAQMIDAVNGQVADIRAIVGPLLPPAGETISEREAASAETRWPLQHIHYLYRDWGWRPEPDDENARVLALVRAVAADRPLGRVLVLGAGACRLAYDLHRAGASDTTVVDLDPLLLAAAQTVIRGGRVQLREANAEIDERDRVCRVWTLEAPNGPIADGRFHFAIADALDPPFEPHSFDAVVTPWFIDVVPQDLRDFIGTIVGLLAPGGRWIDVGPLRYPPARPVPLRFTREEVFELAGMAGFRVDGWRSESLPYLVSKLSARGKVEWVLAFAATYTGQPASVAAGLPPWLVFGHVPIPAAAPQAAAAEPDPLRRAVLAALDGRRTLNDVTTEAARAVARTDVSRADLRSAIRRFLAERFTRS
jgi:SAM-dependent methyltransferase